MEIKYQIFEEDKLLIQKFAGVLEFQKYVRFTKHLSKMYAEFSVNTVIVDFRAVDFQESSEDFSENMDRMIELRRDIHNREERVRNSRIVFWVDKPMPTAVAQMVTRGYNPKSFSFCSTTREIVRVTHLPQAFLDLENFVTHLEHTFL